MRLLKVTRARRYLAMATAASLICLSLHPIFSPDKAIAHEVEVVEDVGATMHIEPNDTPRAGEEVLAWFALTQRGGQTISEADSKCELAIYAQPRQSTDAPVLTPTLTAVDAEGYQDIPGARFTFPKVGAYTLLLSCIPEQASEFDSFELDFEVTVAAGQAVSEPSGAVASQPEAAISNPSSSADPTTADPSSASVRPAVLVKRIALGIGGLIFLGGLAVSGWLSRQKP